MAGFIAVKVIDIPVARIDPVDHAGRLFMSEGAV